MDLSGMYQATYTRIKASDAASAELAQRVLSWICFAQRPLHEVELQHAIATEIEDEDFDPDGITAGDLIRSSCMGLVTRDNDGMCSLFHMTAYEFFRSNPDMSSDISHLLISRTCLTYLSFSSTGRRGPCEDLATLEARKFEFRLLDYAAKHGADHIRHVEAALLEDVLTFLHDDTLRQTLMQAFYHRYRDDEELRRISFGTLPSGSSPLQVACGQGLLLTAQRLLQLDADPKAPDAQGWTPLIAATSYGQLEVIDLLLSHAKDTGKPETGVVKPASNDDSDEDPNDRSGSSLDRSDDIVGLNQPDNDGWTPLFWAIIKNQYQAAEQLLNAGSNVSVQDKATWTPIEWAAFRTDRAFVDLMLRFTSGAQIHGRGLLSPLHLAATAGDHGSVESMLKHGQGIPPGIERNLARFLKVLEKSDRLNVAAYRSRHGPTAMPSLITAVDFSVKLLDSAIRMDQRTMVKMLIELGTSLGPMESEVKRRTPLHVAACCGRYPICEYLLLKGASPSIVDSDGFTAMDLAILIGHPQCTRLFLKFSPPSSTLMERGMSLTAFVFGLKTPNEAGPGELSSCGPGKFHRHDHRNPGIPITSLLMLHERTSGVYSMESDSQSWQVDSVSFEFRDIADILQAFVDFGCDLDAVNGCWITSEREGGQMTALHQACSILNPELASFLVANGADVNRRDRYRGRSPLHQACSHSDIFEETIRTLLKHGSDPNAVDKHGCSVLYTACGSATLRIIQCLVANGAMVKASGDKNDHPLHAACMRSIRLSINPADNIEIIDYILSVSEPDVISIECEGYDGQETPLHLAMIARNWEVVDHLQTLGAKITDLDSLSPILWDTSSDALGTSFRRLLDLGASAKGKCSRRQNKTIIAYYFDMFVRGREFVGAEFEKNLEALLQAGADINASSPFYASSTDKDTNMLRVARERARMGLGQDDLIPILLRHGAFEDTEKDKSKEDGVG